MFDQSRFVDVLTQYKQDFDPIVWKENKEYYKWKAIQCFQNNWKVNASAFPEMLMSAFDDAYNLLDTRYRFPKKMIIEFAKEAPEVVRSMFISLFDESQDVVERIESFKHKAQMLLRKYGNGAKQHYQDENTITTYLWLRFPDRYYIYRFNAVHAATKELHADYSFKKGHYAENIRNCLQFYDELNQSIKADRELVGLFQSHLTDDLYPDPELKTLTVDFAYYIYAYY